ncbi:galactose oxidase [Leucogyrophana mollusca]|uniref:Galactose oxidase n=1 Tax=Leucogyrophana mollusca TaxID=85980 RepID=A0ACB8BUL6_9AGAM|nr:galactose oxidase [Leucogyrophana mollusca]
MAARWTLLSSLPAKARSSHCLSVTNRGLLYLYGGELRPRIPVDSAVHAFDLTQQNVNPSAWTELSPPPSSLAPEARVGASTAWDEGTQSLYLWGGRGGVDMAPLAGAQTGIWRAHLSPDAASAKWERLNAINEEDAPAPRSYHATVSAQGNLYIHAGCPTSGRLGTLHSFDPNTRKWRELASAPEPARGGTSIAAVTLRGEDGPEIIRFGGFAGHELPTKPALDIYSITSDAWRTVVPTQDPKHGHPGSRSVHGFVPIVSKKHPQAVAVMWHGERDASSLGHAGAGTFWDDVWVIERCAESEGNGGLSWRRLDSAAEGGKPEGRGWFPGASYVNEEGETRVVMFGGLLGSNERSGELWLLDIDL